MDPSPAITGPGYETTGSVKGALLVGGPKAGDLLALRPGQDHVVVRTVDLPSGRIPFDPDEPTERIPTKTVTYHAVGDVFGTAIMVPTKDLMYDSHGSYFNTSFRSAVSTIVGSYVQMCKIRETTRLAPRTRLEQVVEK